MSPTTGHAIRLLTRQETAASTSLGLTLCTRKNCGGARAYYASRRNATGQIVTERLCVSHGATYATRHGLVLPPLPQRPTDHTAALPASVIARGADTASTHGAAGRKRWN